MKLEASVEIERPISEVWEWYAVDQVRNHPRWNPDLELEQISDGPMGLGTKIRRRNTMGETPVDGEMEITEWEPPHAVATSIRDGDVETVGQATLEERGPAQTLLTISADMPWLDDPAREGFIQGMMERSVANMKRLDGGRALAPDIPERCGVNWDRRRTRSVRIRNVARGSRGAGGAGTESVARSIPECL